MEMENSRRSAVDRSRDLPGLKKPRLSEDAPDRTTNGVSSRVSSSNARVRANEERDDSIRELVAQYKMALAELTFNSKPIITNLTIIAGENIHAAKGITATICNNVLEVPSEQKLPSLYLLDSIVKNIGRDYIKHFATRLPEVFCKAYKQVDSSIHPGMRHLFGTWKAVFPPSALQIIEKELGFPHAVNVSSGAAASRSDPQSQRPAHSIHVNPKYLERQRLQQTRDKEIQSDESGDVASPTDDTGISDRPTITGSIRQWTGLSGKIPNIQRPQRELSTDPGCEKKGIRDIKNHQFSSVLSRQTCQGGGRIERIKERDELDKSYYGTGSTVSETLMSRRNGFDANQSYGNYRASGSGQVDRQLPSVYANITNKSVHSASKNWKNSGEEEYMWDDMNSKLTDYGGTNSSIKEGRNIDNADKHAGLQRGQWIPLESEQPDFLRDKLDTFSRLKPSIGEDRVPSLIDTDDQYLHSHGQWDADSRRNMETSADPLSVRQTVSGHQVSPMWPQHEPLLPVTGLNPKGSRFSSQPEGVTISLSSGSSPNLISPLPRPGLLCHSRPPSSVPTGSSVLYEQQPLQPPSPPSHPLQSFQPLQHQKLHNTVDHDLPQPQFSQLGQKPIQLSGHINRAAHAPDTQDYPPSFAQNQSQLRHNPPLLHQAQLELPLHQAKTQSQHLTRTEKPQTLSQGSGTQSQRFSSNVSSTNSVDVSGQSSTGDLLAAIMKSGLLPNIPTSGLQNFNMQPPLPTGPPPIQGLPSSGPLVTPSSLPLQISPGNSPAITAGVVLPPLPPGPPPSSKKSDTSFIVSNPFSNLLSSLVAKGVISSPATEMLTVTSTHIANKLPYQSIESSSRTTVQVPSNSDASTIPPSSEKEPFVSEQSAPAGVASLAPYAMELEEDLIGIDFKSEVIRKLHPLVISSLFDDLKQQCDICGLRFKIQEQLQSHADLHSSEKSELNNSDELSRKWYSNKKIWVAGNIGLSEMPEPISLLEEVIPSREKCEPMVPADESQCICALCGEPFEDFYSHERDKWMYKGTVYLNLPERVGDMGSMDEIKERVPIVHAKCLSSSSDNKNVAENDGLVQP